MLWLVILPDPLRFKDTDDSIEDLCFPKHTTFLRYNLYIVEKICFIYLAIMLSCHVWNYFVFWEQCIMGNQIIVSFQAHDHFTDPCGKDPEYGT